MDEFKYFMLTYIDLQEDLSKAEKNGLAKVIIETDESKLRESFFGNVGGGQGITVTQTDTPIFGDIITLTFGEGAQDAIASIALTTLVTSLIVTSSKLYQRYVSKYGKKCKDYKGKAKILCMANARVAAVAKQIEALTKAKRACTKRKDPRKCIQKMDSKINSLKLKQKNFDREKQMALLKLKRTQEKR